MLMPPSRLRDPDQYTRQSRRWKSVAADLLDQVPSCLKSMKSMKRSPIVGVEENSVAEFATNRVRGKSSRRYSRNRRLGLHENRRGGRPSDLIRGYATADKANKRFLGIYLNRE